MSIEQFPEELDYVSSTIHFKGPDDASFLGTFCLACLKADTGNYIYLRPALRAYMAKYPARRVERKHTHTRIYFMTAGGHVHTDWWSGGSRELTHGNNSGLTFTLEEWETVRSVFQKFPEIFELVDRTPNPTAENF